MALFIENREAGRLARELAARTGETITEAVVKALRERLRRENVGTGIGLPRRALPGRALAGRALKDEIMVVSRRAGRLPRRSGKTPEEIIDYDKRGVPR